MLRTVKKAAKRVLPPGTIGFRIAQSAGRRLRIVPPAPSGDVAYAEWIRRGEPQLWNYDTDFKYKPLISIVVPVFNAPDYYLLPMIYSITNQRYQNWELVLVNASTDQACRDLTQACADIDDRITIAHVEKNEGIGMNTNIGIKQCTGDYIALLDHDDLLSPFALSEVVHALQGDSRKRPQFIYSDEDKLSEDGDYRFDPHFKPDWSPQILRSVNYLNHFTVMEAGMLRKTGGIRKGFDGAQDFDLYLRLTDEQPRILHIPKILYHWRAARNSTAQDFSLKKGVTDSGERALSEHIRRHKYKATVHALPKRPGFYAMKFELPVRAKASIIVMPVGRGNKDQQQSVLAQALKAAKSSQARTEIIAPVAVKRPEANAPAVQVITAEDSHRYLSRALAAAQGDFVVVMSAAVTADKKHHDWVDRLGGLVCQDDQIGVVEPMLLDKGTGVLLDAGFVSQEGRLIPLFEGTAPATHTYFGSNDWARNVQALSGRVWSARTPVARAYCDGYSLDYQRMLDAKLQVVFWPFVRLHFSGDLRMTGRHTPFFHHSLQYTQGQLTLPKVANLPVRRYE